MGSVPYEVLDHAITQALLARDEVIRRNQELRPRHQLYFMSKKADTQTITIRAHYCREPLRFYLRLLHNRTIITADPDHPRHKDPITHPPLHHEHQKRNHGWPNEMGKVSMDSKLMFNKKLGQWTFVWVYGKDIAVPRDDQAENLSVCAIDPGVRTFLTW